MKIISYQYYLLFFPISSPHDEDTSETIQVWTFYVWGKIILRKKSTSNYTMFWSRELLIDFGCPKEYWRNGKAHSVSIDICEHKIVLQRYIDNDYDEEEAER